MPLLWPEALRVRLFSLKQVAAGLPQRASQRMSSCSKSSLDLPTYTRTLGQSREHTAPLN